MNNPTMTPTEIAQHLHNIRLALHSELTDQEQAALKAAEEMAREATE